MAEYEKKDGAIWKFNFVGSDSGKVNPTLNLPRWLFLIGREILQIH